MRFGKTIGHHGLVVNHFPLNVLFAALAEQGSLPEPQEERLIRLLRFLSVNY
jgi:hypothetical protein